MRAWDIALFMFVLGAVIGAINTLEIFDAPLPDQNINVTQANVQQLTDTAQNVDAVNLYVNPVTVWQMFNVLIVAFSTALDIAPLLQSYGVPGVVAYMLQAPIWLLYIWALVQFKANRGSKSMD